MSDKQSNLTDKEMEDLQSIVTDTLASVCAMADKHNIDRDSMLKYLCSQLLQKWQAYRIMKLTTLATASTTAIQGIMSLVADVIAETPMPTE